MTLNRRTFLTTAAAAVAIVAVPIPFATAATRSDVSEALGSILGDRTAEEGGITLDVPNVAENGAQVPIGIHVDSPMSRDDHVTAIHVVATANPTPGIGSFHLTPALGRAEVATRIRLAEGQEVLVLAELSDGRVIQAAVQIGVTLGGCAT
jgi:sulfur-oxidizing protein SoxY